MLIKKKLYKRITSILIKDYLYNLDLSLSLSLSFNNIFKLS